MRHNLITATFVLCCVCLFCFGCATIFTFKDGFEGKDVSANVTYEKYGNLECYKFNNPFNFKIYDLVVEDNKLWLAVDGGLIRHSIGNSRWEMYGKIEGFPGDLANSITFWNGLLYFDTSIKNIHEKGYMYLTGNGVYTLNTSNFDLVKFISSKNQDVKAYGGMLYNGAYHGIEVRDLKTGEKSVFRSSNSDYTHFNYNTVLVDGPKIWITSLGEYERETKDFKGGGVTVLSRDDGKGNSYSAADGLAHSYCYDIVKVGKNIWVSHWDEERGLSLFDHKSSQWKVIRTSDNGVEVGGVHLAALGNKLLIGQQGALVVLDTETLHAKKYTEEDGLPGYIVTGIAVKENTAWISLWGEGRKGKRSGVAKLSL